MKGKLPFQFDGAEIVDDPTPFYRRDCPYCVRNYRVWKRGKGRRAIVSRETRDILAVIA